MEKRFRKFAHSLFGRYFRERRDGYQSLQEDLVSSRMDISADQWLSTAVLSSLLVAALVVPSIYAYLLMMGSTPPVDPAITAGLTVLVIAAWLFLFCGRFEPRAEISLRLEDVRRGEKYSLNKPILALLVGAAVVTLAVIFSNALFEIGEGLWAFISHPVQSFANVFCEIQVAVGAFFDRVVRVLTIRHNLLCILYGLIPLATYLMTLLTFNYYPRVKAWQRKRRIDGLMDSAVSLMGSVAGVGLTPYESIKFIAEEEAYEEVSEEMSYLARDVDLYGMDLVSALRKLSEETASGRLRSFLQGAVTTITSGGNLREYFMVKSEKYSRETEQELEEYLDSLGLVAEVFLVAGVVAPTLIIVILSLMVIMGHATPIMLYGVILVVPVVTFTVSMMADTLEPPSVR